MPPHLSPRTDAQWIDALRAAAGPDAERALGELARFLRGLLARVLRGRATDDDLADFTQEALLQIVARLSGFRGESRFTTWAGAVATRVAFTELRRRSVRERGRQSFEEILADARAVAGRALPSADDVAARRRLLAALEQAIATELTERQRTAILAELRGVPTVEIAARLDTNQNALYKLVHDARRKLRQALERAGYDAASVRAELEEGVSA